MGQGPPDHQEGLEVILEAVYLYFKGNRDDVENWLRTPNPKLGGDPPLTTIRSDRLDLLADLVKTMINEME